MIDSTKRQDTEMPLSQRAVDTAFQLLHQAQYEPLVQLLTDFQLHAGEDGVSAAGYELLTMMRSLAVACHLFNRSAIWHQQVGDEAFNQQEETAAVLKEFMQMLRDGDWEVLARQADFTLPYRQNGHGHDNLWQRIKRLFQGNGVDGMDSINPPVFSTVTAHISDHEQPLAARNGKHTHPAAQPTKQPLAATDTAQHDTEHTLLVYGLGVFCVYHQDKAHQ
jgi:hypothetical protein